MPEPYGFGHGHGFGGAPFAGDVPDEIIPPESGQGLKALVGNDRLQLIALADSGEDGGVPEMRYWYGASIEWGEIIGARRRSQLVKRYSTNEHGDLVVGAVELPMLPIAKGNEATVAGVLIEVTARPWNVGTFDGGMATTEALGVSAYVEGWRQPDVERTVGSAGRKSDVVRSETLDWSIDARDVDSGVWPARFSVFLPCRITDHVRSVRVGIAELRGCEFVSAEIIGGLFASRLG